MVANLILIVTPSVLLPMGADFLMRRILEVKVMITRIQDSVEHNLR